MSSPVAAANSTGASSKNLDTSVADAYSKILKISGKSLNSNQLSEIQQVFEELLLEANDAEHLIKLQNAAIDDLTQTNDQLLARVTKISDEHLSLSTQYATLEARAQQHQQEMDNLQSANVTATTNYSDLKKQTDALKTEALELHQKYERLKQQFDDVTQQTDALKSKTTELDNTNVSLANEYDNLQKANDELKQESVALTQKCSDLEALYAQLKNETHDLTVRYDDLNADYAKLQTVVDAALKNRQVSKTQNHADDLLLKLWNTSWTVVVYQLPLSAQIPFHFIYACGRYIIGQR